MAENGRTSRFRGASSVSGPRVGHRHRACLVFTALAWLCLSGCGPSKAQLRQMDEDAKFHYDLAHGYYFDPKTPNADAALAEVTRSLAIKEPNESAHLLAGIIYFGRQEYPQAITHYKRAIELKPDLYYAINNLAVTYLVLERWDEAIGLLSELITLPLYDQPGHAHNNLGWAWLNKRDYRKAEEHLVKAISLAPQLCLAYNNLGLLYLDTNRPDRAAKRLDSAIEKCPNYAEPHYHLGRLRAGEGAWGEARKAFKRCEDLAGESPLADRCSARLQRLPAEERP